MGDLEELGKFLRPVIHENSTCFAFSDGTLNPNGVRFGSAEIYNAGNCSCHHSCAPLSTSTWIMLTVFSSFRFESQLRQTIIRIFFCLVLYCMYLFFYLKKDLWRMYSFFFNSFIDRWID